MNINNILFVCVGNICRSCTAEKLFVHKLKNSDANPQDFSVSSVGLSAPVGESIHPFMLNLLNKFGVRDVEHRASQATDNHFIAADLILVMESFHRNSIIKRLPSVAGKCFLLSHWEGGKNILDPYGRDEFCFNSVYKQIQLGVNSWYCKTML